MKRLRIHALGLALVGSCLAGISAIAADCGADQQARDAAAYSIYQTQYQNNWNAYDQAVRGNNMGADLAVSICDSTRYFARQDCTSTRSNMLATADAEYTQGVADCYLNHTNQADIDKCVCNISATYNRAVSHAYAVQSHCETTAENAYNRCASTAYATRDRDNGLAYAAYLYSQGQTDATYTRTLVLSSYAAQLCYLQQNIAAANGSLATNCAQYPQNCCVNNCAIAYNNAYLSAQSAFLQAVGPADATRQYTQIMCNAAQNRDNQTTSANTAFTIAQAAANYYFTIGEAAKEYNFAMASINANHAEAVHRCSCDSTNYTAYTNCVAAADALRDEQTATHTGIYNQTCAQAWNTYEVAYAAANSAAQLAYEAHQATANTCNQAAQDAFNATYNAAIATLNAAMQAASNAYSDCVRACGVE